MDESDTMRLLCIGDIGITNEELLQRAWVPPGTMLPGEEMKLLLNWELPIGDAINPRPRSRGPRLLAHPASPEVLRKWSPGFAALATNHILDAGEAGLIQTIQTLNRLGFTTMGAGETWEEITRTLFWETDEGRLAIINWVFPEAHPDWMCVPGPNCWPGLQEAGQVIQRAKRQANWVLLLLHWSDEHFPYPRPKDRSTARALAEMGADLVVAHHPHVVRGMEMIGPCPVFYSIGDFYMSDIKGRYNGWVLQRAPRHREALGVEVSFRQGERPVYRISSFWQGKDETVADPIRRAARTMERVSYPLRRFQGSRYAEWYAAKRARFDKWGARWHFGVRRLGVRGLIRHGSRLLAARLRVSH
jgi:hypothetical protein